ncbi:MAG: SagB/ThcOx family dehydrogenase, partial [Dehalococcoidia bacterium]
RREVGRVPLVLSFRSFVTLEQHADGTAELTTGEGTLPLGRPSKGLLRVLRRLSTDGAGEDELAGLVVEHGSPADLPALTDCLDRLRDDGLTCFTLVHDGAAVARILPASPRWRQPTEQVRPDERLVLSRFAYLHRLHGTLVVESPLALSRVELLTPAAATIVALLAEPSTIDSLCGRTGAMPAEPIAELVTLLVAEGIVCRIDGDGVSDEDRLPAARQWEFHDLLFHARSRLGRHEYPSGGVFPHPDSDPLPAVRPPLSGERIPLARPDVGALSRADTPFTRVLEERASSRRHGATPITADQLGEFLYRAARVRGIIEANRKHTQSYEASSRPYPSAGAMYELEIYLAVNRCAGIEPGLYHYDALSHSVERVCRLTPAVSELLAGAAASAVMVEPPQVLIVLATRFERLSWKYASIAYSLTLKNVGALQQTMYLVATAMGLAACALGAGDSDLFAVAANMDYLTDPSVGEFILGSKPNEAG